MGSPPVVIINERLAAEFGDVDPIGRRINLGDWVTVVGVVSDVAPGNRSRSRRSRTSTCPTSSSRCRS